MYENGETVIGPTGEDGFWTFSANPGPSKKTVFTRPVHSARAITFHCSSMAAVLGEQIKTSVLVVLVASPMNNAPHDLSASYWLEILNTKETGDRQRKKEVNALSAMVRFARFLAYLV